MRDVDFKNGSETDAPPQVRELRPPDDAEKVLTGEDGGQDDEGLVLPGTAPALDGREPSRVADKSTRPLLLVAVFIVLLCLNAIKRYDSFSKGLYAYLVPECHEILDDWGVAGFPLPYTHFMGADPSAYEFAYWIIPVNMLLCAGFLAGVDLCSSWMFSRAQRRKVAK